MNGSEAIPRALARELERAEIEQLRSFYEAADPSVVAACGLRAADIGSAVAAVASRVDVLALNRVIGLGIDGSLTRDLLQRVVALYAEAGVPRFFVQLSPAAPEGVAPMLEEHGFRLYNRWVKLYLDEPDAVSAAPNPLRVERIDAEDSGVFADIVAGAFGWPIETRPWIAATVGRTGWTHYVAFDGAEPIATGALFLHGEVGGLTFGCTRVEYRGRGAQAVLIARRLGDAAALGCRRLVVETAEDTPERSAPSYRNLRRFGFRVAYLRPNYLLAPSGS